MRLVVALGGNALLRRGEALTLETQGRRLAEAAAALAPLCSGDHEVVITHGNGPQVGLLAMQAAATPETPVPLDVLDAESAGMIGYQLDQALLNAMPAGRQVVTLLTQVRVDPHDPAFGHPSKPIGPTYDADQARALAAARGWQVAPEGASDAARWRRVVASPMPLEVLEEAAITLLLSHGVVVICLGGGGIPVVRRADGGLVGVEAVIDKDVSSALLAETIGADRLILLTDVEGVFLDWGTAWARRLDRTTPAELATHRFAAGSMGPKVAAASRFVLSGRGLAAIGSLDQVGAILEGRAGTWIMR